MHEVVSGTKRGFGKIRGWKRIMPVLPGINILGNILKYISFDSIAHQYYVFIFLIQD